MALNVVAQRNTVCPLARLPGPPPSHPRLLPLAALLARRVAELSAASNSEPVLGLGPELRGEAGDLLGRCGIDFGAMTLACPWSDRWCCLLDLPEPADVDGRAGLGALRAAAPPVPASRRTPAQVEFCCSPRACSVAIFCGGHALPFHDWVSRTQISCRAKNSVGP